MACNGQLTTTGGVATVGLATWLDKAVARIGVQLLAMTVHVFKLLKKKMIPENTIISSKFMCVIHLLNNPLNDFSC